MVTTIDTIWSDTLAYLKERVPRQVFETWFSPAQLESLEDGSARITVPNRFFGDWLGEHYGELLGEALSVAKGGGASTSALSSEIGQRLH